MRPTVRSTPVVPAGVEPPDREDPDVLHPEAAAGGSLTGAAAGGSLTVPGRSPKAAAVTLFAIPLASAMSDQDLASLAQALDFDARLAAAGSPPEDRLSPARLDQDSGLFLKAGEGQGRWVLEARTWGHPDPDSVHRWNVSAATAARRIDPTVELPERRGDPTPEVSDGRVGRVENTRFAGLRRRLTGV
jgi:hypothetical protein